MHNVKSMLPANKTAFNLLIRGLRKLLVAGVEPEDVTRALLASWMEDRSPHLPAPESSEALRSKPEIQKFVLWLTQCEVITGAFWLSSAYTHLIEPGYRKANAMYFTPPSLTTRLIDNVQQHRELSLLGRIVDPACGGAAFLAPAAQRIAKILLAQGGSADSVLRHIEANLFGCDTSEFLCLLSSTFLQMVLADLILEAGRAPYFNIVVGDGLSLFEEVRGTFSLVLCNPPYRKMTQVELAPHADAYKAVLKGQPNLYSLFILRATQLLAPAGVAGLLTPMSFLSGQSFSGVRSELLAKGAVRQLDLIHAKSGVFLGAEQDTVITTWVKETDSRQPIVAYCLAGDICTPAGKLTLSSSALGPWPVPRACKDAELLPLFSCPPSNLMEYGYSSRTGAIVIHRDSRPRFLEEADGIPVTGNALKSKGFPVRGPKLSSSE